MNELLTLVLSRRKGCENNHKTEEKPQKARHDSGKAFQKQTRSSRTLSHWHQREPDKRGGDINHPGATALPLL